jgi:hypothetical protein
MCFRDFRINIPSKIYFELRNIKVSKSTFNFVILNYEELNYELFVTLPQNILFFIFG